MDLCNILVVCPYDYSTLNETMNSIALIAHDGKKAEMVSFALQHINLLEEVNIYTTATTGMDMEEAGLEITKMLSGPKGGDAQIAAMVATHQLDAVIFFGIR